MASELKPCPFCGKEAKRQENRSGGIVVYCNSLDCELLSVDGEAGSVEDNDAVIAAWNTRKGIEAERVASRLMGMEDATRAYSDEAFQALESRLAAHTEAAKLALAVLEDELGNRVGGICVQREDGTWDRSALSDDEQKYITECEAAIKALTDAMGGK